MRPVRGLVAGMAVVILAATTAVPPWDGAAANNFSGASQATGCSTVNMQDNSTMTFHRSSLQADVHSAVAFTHNNHVAPTDITVAAEEAVADSNTDVVYFDDDYSTICGATWHPSGTTIGMNSCQSLSGSKCQRANVRFDNSWTSSVDDNWDRALTCHEIGHTLGLKHRANSGTEIGCMPGTLPLAVNYSSHDVPHINGNY